MLQKLLSLVGLLSVVLAVPHLALAQLAIVYAGEHGALVCSSPEPLNTYLQIFRDAEAKAKFLKSRYVAECRVVPKGSAFGYLGGHSVIALREKGDFETVYGILGEWTFEKQR
jgi:hypothetical protein